MDGNKRELERHLNGNPTTLLEMTAVLSDVRKIEKS
jgi:hypothetical protein